MTTTYTGGLRPYPGMSPTWDAHQRAVAHGILLDVHDAIGVGALTHAPDADLEDFWEDACRLSAAWRAADGDLRVADELDDWTFEETTDRLGPISIIEEGGRHARDRQVMHPLLLEHGGAARSMTLLTLTTDDQISASGSVDAADWMVSRAHAGVPTVILKNAERKNGIWVLPTSASRADCTRAIADALDWTSVRLEGARNALVGQDCIDMRWEYRCFVVDGTVITAAGCIEEHTPLDFNPTAGTFQTRLREHRGHLTRSPSPVVDRPDIAHRLGQFATTAARQHGGTIVIDVAMDHLRDAPIIVELNEVPNSGLYATDPWAVFEALMTARDRGYLTGI